MPKDSILDHVLGSMFGDMINDVIKARMTADAIAKLAKQYGLGHAGTQLLAMAFRLRQYANDSVNAVGGVEPTLWIVDHEERQWAMGAEITASDDEHDESKATALLLKRLGAVCYLIIRETTSTRVSMNMTQLEKKAARDNSDNIHNVVCMYGEAIDGSAVIMSYLREKDGKIDIDTPFSSTVGPKWAWPGPHGSTFTDHGMRELLPRPQRCGTCGEAIMPHPLTGTTCACARGQR